MRYSGIRTGGQDVKLKVQYDMSVTPMFYVIFNQYKRETGQNFYGVPRVVVH